MKISRKKIFRKIKIWGIVIERGTSRDVAVALRRFSDFLFGAPFGQVPVMEVPVMERTVPGYSNVA